MKDALEIFVSLFVMTEYPAAKMNFAFIIMQPVIKFYNPQKEYASSTL